MSNLFFIAKNEPDGRQVIELWDMDHNVFIVAIYPHERDVAIVSKFLWDVSVDKLPPAKATVRFEW